jgi:hypothetical protein
MSGQTKSKATSVIDTAAALVDRWSDSKRAAFEQRTGLSLPRETKTTRQKSTEVRQAARDKRQK